MRPADRLREAKKQLTIVAEDDDLSEIQQRTAAHLGGLVGALGETLEVLEDGELVADGGQVADERDGIVPEPLAADEQTADNDCQYEDCESAADYRVQLENGFIFYCCQSCSSQNRIYAKENELLDNEVKP